VLDAGWQHERSALAGVAANEALRSELEDVPPEFFDDELHRRARAYLLGQESADGELTALLPELYAMSEVKRITEETARQLLLRLRARGIRRELQSSEGERTRELQEELMRLQVEIPSLG